jgi:ppGpp synthetase/RelA/SpoT-type nucleotidyltranferase
MSLLDDPSAWEDWFHKEIKPIIDPAWFELSDATERRLEGLNAEAEADEGVRRDRWRVFAPCPIKSAERVRVKLRADGVCEDANVLNRALLLGDLARFRIVATLKRDVALCRRALISADGATFLNRYAVHAVKDFVHDEKLRKPLLGHRALQLVVEVPCEGRAMRAEVQMMTELQHAWDRRNHVMYEWLRENEDCSCPELHDLRIDDHAVAESLHALDSLADHNFETFLRLRSRA